MPAAPKSLLVGDLQPRKPQVTGLPIPEPSKPQIESFPIADRGRSLLVTLPEDGARFKLPGFDLVDSDDLPPLAEGFDDHSEVAGSMSVLFKKQAEPSTKEIIEQNVGLVKPEPTKHHQKYLATLQGFDSWQTLPEYLDKIPSGFGEPKYNQKDPGFRWQMKDEYGTHNIRIDKGDLGAKHPTQQVDHVIISYNGRIVDKTGKNYIMCDETTSSIYTISREKVDKGITGEQEAKEVQDFSKWFDELTEDIGSCKSDSEYLDYPQWPKVWEGAKKLYEMMEANDKKYAIHASWDAWRKSFKKEE